MGGFQNEAVIYDGGEWRWRWTVTAADRGWSGLGFVRREVVEPWMVDGFIRAGPPGSPVYIAAGLGSGGRVGRAREGRGRMVLAVRVGAERSSPTR